MVPFFLSQYFEIHYSNIKHYIYHKHIYIYIYIYIYISFTLSLESRIFNLDLTKKSFSVFGLRNATREGDGKTESNLGEWIVYLCALFNIWWTLFSAGWYVKTKVRLSFLSCFSHFLDRFSLFMEWTFINPTTKPMLSTLNSGR